MQERTAAEDCDITARFQKTRQPVVRCCCGLGVRLKQ